MNRRRFLRFLAVAPVAAPVAAQAAFSGAPPVHSGGVVVRMRSYPVLGVANERGLEAILPLRAEVFGFTRSARPCRPLVIADASGALMPDMTVLADMTGQSEGSHIAERRSPVEQVVDPVGHSSAAAVPPVSESEAHPSEVAIGDAAAAQQNGEQHLHGAFQVSGSARDAGEFVSVE